MFLWRKLEKIPLNYHFTPFIRSTGQVSTAKSQINSSAALPLDLPIPQIVHQIVWRNTLTFRNYLSIISVYKHLRPYRMVIYVSKKFKQKEYDYNTWYQKAAQQIPYLEMSHLDQLGKGKGEYSVKEELGLISAVLGTFGGVYVNINAIMTRAIRQKIKHSFQAGLTNTSVIGFVMAANSGNLTHYFSDVSKPEHLENHTYGIKCTFPETFESSDDCCIIQKEIFPRDVIYQQSHFGSTVRTLFYDNANVPEPERIFPPIPKIVHYVWFGKKSITYSMYLSFESTIRFVKPLKIFIYVDTYSLGKYFDEMKLFSCVQIVFYGTMKSIFQRPIQKLSHVSDVLRADVLLRHGGIYLDWDAYWLKPVDDLLSLGYETIATLDHYKDMDPRQGFPDTINMGVLLARPNSRFINEWQDSFRQYTGKHATFHAVEMVYKVYEEHPDLLYIEKRLQVMCFQLRCHPLWLPNYKLALFHNTFDFKKDAYAVHFTDPIPKPFSSESELKRSKGFFADMARHVHGIQ